MNVQGVSNSIRVNSLRSDNNYSTRAWYKNNAMQPDMFIKSGNISFKSNKEEVSYPLCEKYPHSLLMDENAEIYAEKDIPNIYNTYKSMHIVGQHKLSERNKRYDYLQSLPDETQFLIFTYDMSKWLNNKLLGSSIRKVEVEHLGKDVQLEAFRYCITHPSEHLRETTVHGMNDMNKNLVFDAYKLIRELSPDDEHHFWEEWGCPSALIGKFNPKTQIKIFEYAMESENPELTRKIAGCINKMSRANIEKAYDIAIKNKDKETRDIAATKIHMFDADDVLRIIGNTLEYGDDIFKSAISGLDPKKSDIYWDSCGLTSCDKFLMRLKVKLEKCCSKDGVDTAKAKEIIEGYKNSKFANLGHNTLLPN